MQKKYITLNKLDVFLTNLKKIFAPLSHTHKLSQITDYSVDDYMSSTSTRPVQNKIINNELENIKSTYVPKTGANDIIGNLSPLSDIVNDLGEEGKRWNNIYSDKVTVSKANIGRAIISYDAECERIVFSFE